MHLRAPASQLQQPPIPRTYQGLSSSGYSNALPNAWQQGQVLTQYDASGRSLAFQQFAPQGTPVAGTPLAGTPLAGTPLLGSPRQGACPCPDSVSQVQCTSPAAPVVTFAPPVAAAMALLQGGQAQNMPGRGFQNNLSMGQRMPHEALQIRGVQPGSVSFNLIPPLGTPLAGTPLVGTPLAGTPLAGTPLAGTPRESRGQPSKTRENLSQMKWISRNDQPASVSISSGPVEETRKLYSAVSCPSPFFDAHRAPLSKIRTQSSMGECRQLQMRYQIPQPSSQPSDQSSQQPSQQRQNRQVPAVVPPLQITNDQYAPQSHMHNAHPIQNGRNVETGIPMGGPQSVPTVMVGGNQLQRVKYEMPLLPQKATPPMRIVSNPQKTEFQSFTNAQVGISTDKVLVSTDGIQQLERTQLQVSQLESSVRTQLGRSGERFLMELDQGSAAPILDAKGSAAPIRFESGKISMDLDLADLRNQVRALEQERSKMSSQPKAVSTCPDGIFSVGDVVVLQGLMSNAHLNGTTAEVVEPAPEESRLFSESGRMIVRTLDGQRLAVRPQRLRRASSFAVDVEGTSQFCIGEEAFIGNLRPTAGMDLNGEPVIITEPTAEEQAVLEDDRIVVTLVSSGARLMIRPRFLVAKGQPISSGSGSAGSFSLPARNAGFNTESPL